KKRRFAVTDSPPHPNSCVADVSVLERRRLRPGKAMRILTIPPLYASLALAACTQSADLGSNRSAPASADGGAPGAAAPSASPATTGLSVGRAAADAVPNMDLIGVAFTHSGGSNGSAVGFVLVDHAGNPKSNVVSLGESASDRAGVAVTVDPAARMFYTGW